MLHTVSTSGSSKKPTRIAILDAAVELFRQRAAEHADDVRVMDIAKRAGVSRRSVYVHFGSRTGLLVAMVQHFDAEGILEGLVQRIFDAPTSLDALDAVVHLHAEYSPVAYPVAGVLMSGMRRDKALRAAWDDRMEARRQVYRDVVKWLNRDGLLSSEWKIDAATEMVYALTSWQVWEQLVVERGWSKKRYATYLSAALRHMLTGSS